MIKKTVTNIFRKIFDDETLEVTPETTADDIDGWDSLSHINLIVAIEREFHIHFDQKELLRQHSVGDLLADIERKVGAAS